MRLRTIQRILGVLLALFSLTMLPPLGVGILVGDAHWHVFALSFLIVLGAGLLLWYPARHDRRDLRVRDGFVIAALFWIVLGLFGAVPLLLSDVPALGFTDAVFESISGITTTGATVLQGVDLLPQPILFYRQQLQWFGGLGIIVLAVAVLPMLGVGGMQLYRAEMPGPMKDSKLTPRITETAKALWYLYLSLTALCALAYWLAGMSVFDAICHAFSTIALAGFSTHDLSLAYFDSRAIETIAVIFMAIGGVNFSLHFLAWRGRSLRHYAADPEFRAYVWILMVLSVFVVAYLAWREHYGSFLDTLRFGVFHAVSFATTAGFTIENYALWPAALPVLLVLVSFIGGCGGSAAGGIKVIRALLMYKQGMREIDRLIHPSAEIPVKLGGKAVQQRVVDAVWGFFAVYVVVFAVLMLVMLMSGLDHISAFAAVAATLNNLGPGLGEVASSFSDVNELAKWAAVMAMLLGRLEIFALLVLATPSFWRG